MKNREYLHVVVTTNSGRIFENPLKLSEVHLISIMAKENASLEVKRLTMSEKQYNNTFV